MPSMRVHELAKEFNLSSKEMLDKLHEMKIPAKSHASMLADAYVAKIRKKLAAELGTTESGEPSETSEAALSKKEAEEKKAEEERARREAVEHERASREAERARRANAGKRQAAGEPEAKAAKPRVPETHSPFEKLESQIESEKERVAREAAEAKARARAAAAAREVAKKQAVEEALRQRQHRKPAKSQQAEHPKPAPAPAARKSGGFDSLLSQIESEAKRIEEQKKQKAASPTPAGRKAGKKGHGKKGVHFEQIVPELEAQMAEPEDRYAQMAVQAEKLQRDKVLAEARAAVAAATSHEGEGRRKKRKQKREAEARERAELEAIEKGLDPTLVLVGLAGGKLIEAGRAANLATAQEFFADRNYMADGTLVPRKQENAVIADENFAVARVVRAVQEGTIEAVDGSTIEVAADTICIHGDNAHALEFAKKIRTALAQADVELKPCRAQ